MDRITLSTQVVLSRIQDVFMCLLLFGKCVLLDQENMLVSYLFLKIGLFPLFNVPTENWGL